MISTILERARQGQEITPEEGYLLLTEPYPQAWLQQAADDLRRTLVGEPVSYVVNRNLNFTNICEQHCSFCAFRRDGGQPGSYWLTSEQMVAKVQDALGQGATEICLQGGLHPGAQRQGSTLNYYLDLVSTIKTTAPKIHLHAFSPQEVQFISRQDGISIADVLKALQESGVDSLPGTAAEVLDDRVRRVICPEKIDTATWLSIITQAHEMGIPTTSTMLCGHVETSHQQIQHLHHLRELQRRTVGLTEFILLPFVGAQAPAPLRRRVGRDQPDLSATLRLTAVARLFLGRWVKHHQPSWVKLELAGAVQALQWGCDDIGGTLMEEHITTMAGAKGGTGKTVQELQNAIAALGRPHWQRTTLYQPCQGVPELLACF
ncbi:FO synthase subunit 2 [Gloeomargarita lithophora Alchichica-D10]|uniref:5-amino-6-(D-ribitylamino)uracil--L-tyrosine 4-hydroxyphenyl transferase n=1 Tax=Gloeomargarita lithophora Alchichica-D10 TaxID=1188229 RepID=A0A1J0ACB6_9CYAN|nr:7,8-didemethyl-8-hydroxy-5-deazariboflavin synthase subunit CofH [Gloeomargarita lithophora]APB33559.1 FO synthase subunit 2 [Gloeomargarita lithophora Alchichica-D10]